MNTRTRLEAQLCSLTGGFEVIGGRALPVHGADLESKMHAAEQAILALRGGLLSLADEVDRLSEQIERTRLAA